MTAYWKPAELRAAARRDAHDIAQIEAALGLMRPCLEGIRRLDYLRHPDVRWGISEAEDMLAEHIRNAEATLLAIRRTPGVVEDEL